MESGIQHVRQKKGKKKTHERSQSMAALPKKISDLDKNQRIRKGSFKRKLSKKKLEKIDFLSISLKPESKNNYDVEKKHHLKLASNPISSRKKSGEKILSKKKRKNIMKIMKRSNSSVIGGSGKVSISSRKDFDSVTSSPRKPLRMKGILRMSQKAQKKEMIRSGGETLQGYNPLSRKPNQDRNLIHNFVIGNLKINLYAVADGHGKFFEKFIFFFMKIF